MRGSFSLVKVIRFNAEKIIPINDKKMPKLIDKILKISFFWYFSEKSNADPQTISGRVIVSFKYLYIINESVADARTVIAKTKKERLI